MPSPSNRPSSDVQGFPSGSAENGASRLQATLDSGATVASVAKEFRSAQAEKKSCSWEGSS